ncbi:MAG TPA: hypothetical protein VEH04_15010 [Verrucomicrobiae bacterium]|nr:hypothetical protein [Verrucomicrobiae bacterium]
MAKTRINIPKQPTAIIALSQAIAGGHKENGKQSPLNILEWDKIEPLIKEAKEVDDKINQLYVELDKVLERRRILIENPAGVSDFVRRSRDILVGMYRNETAKLGDYGFELTGSRPKKETEAPAS